MIRWVDEYRTSKCCACCGGEMEQAVLFATDATPRTNPARLAGARQIVTLKANRKLVRDDPSYPFGDAHEAERGARYFASDKPASSFPAGTRIARTRAAAVVVGEDGRSLHVPAESDLVSAYAASGVTFIQRWGLKVCRSVTCVNRLVCRDKNADWTICARVQFALHAQVDPATGRKPDGPAYLRRPGPAAAAAAAAAIAAAPLPLRGAQDSR
jgi:hypothetical protein